MNWIKRKFIEISTIFLSIFITLVLFEFFLVYENNWDPVEVSFVEIHNKNYEFIKDPEIPNIFQEKNEKEDVFILGDSFVMGIACAANKANFPCHLDQMINQKGSVINLGVNGMSPVNYLDFIDELKISNGDKILVVLYDNDIHLSESNCDQILRQSKKFKLFVPSMCSHGYTNDIDKSKITFFQRVNYSLKKFKTFQLVKESLAQIPFLQENFYRYEYRNRWSDFEAEENKWMISTLKIMKEISKERGSSIYFTYYPNTNRISEDDERHNLWLKFINYAEINHDLLISDPYPYIIRNAKSASMVWSLTDKHPNCDAHKLMAEFIYQDLIES